MSKQNSIVITILAVIVLVIAIVWSAHRSPTTSLPNQEEGSMENNGVVSSEEDTVIRAKIVEFGGKLKNVSLLAPDVNSLMQTQYGAYLTPTLLAKWKANPSSALGRQSSSPWPDRIEITSVKKQTSTKYMVEGRVLEIASTNPDMADMGSYAVTITVEKVLGAWLITDVVKGAYIKVSDPITINGTSECLPHKDTSGPQTMECAFGLKADGSSLHYALDFGSVAGGAPNLPMNKRLHVVGTLTPANQLNSDMWQRYPITGIISVTSYQQI